MSVIVGIFWTAMAIVGFVCLDVATSPDASATAWIWYRIPSFCYLMVSNFLVSHCARLAGAWRRNPDTSGDALVYNPTPAGKWLVLLSCRLMGKIASHPLSSLPSLGPDFSSNIKHLREKQRADVVGERRWRDIPEYRGAA